MFMSAEELVVHGAREHNLKDITVRPAAEQARRASPGLSGSGKSSLAFDTIYAEGQRRYVESLSAYARQFLQMMEKPDVDSIDGLSPAISIDQKTTSRNPRSTVGTVTEIYDYLRLLYARVGRPHCPICGRPIAGQSVEQIVDQVLQLPEGTRFTVNAPVVRDRKGEYRDVFEELRSEGFTRVKVDGEQHLLEEPIELDKKFKHTIEVVVDRLVDEAGPPHAALAVDRDRGRARRRARRASTSSTASELLFSRELRLPRARRLAAGAPAAHLLVQLAARRLPALHRPRLAAGDRPRPLVPDPTLSIAEGALVPWSVGELELLRGGDRRRSPTATRSTSTRRGSELSSEQQDHSSTAPKATGSTSSTATGWAAGARTCSRSRASSRTSQRRYKETDSSQMRERIEEYMSFRPCPVCKGARLKPEVLAVTVGDRNIHEFTRMSVTTRARVPRRAAT